MYNNNPNFTIRPFDGRSPPELEGLSKYENFFLDLKKGNLYSWGGLVHIIPTDEAYPKDMFKGSTLLVLDDFFLVHNIGDMRSSYVRVLDLSTQRVGMVWAATFYLAKKMTL
jgi:hypothetical protein